VEPARVLGRPEELDRMVGHLVDNAVRHASSRVAVGLRSTGGTALLHVDDDGPGVPADQRAAVFERFGRLQEGRSRDSGGAGLGLAVVRRIAERHGGSVAVHDSPLGGARFEVVLPAPG
jgi:signal transduction histidine kinase